RRPLPGARQPASPPARRCGARPRYPVPDGSAVAPGRPPALGAPGRLLLRRGQLPELPGPHDRQALSHPAVRGQKVHQLRCLPDRLRAADELAGTVGEDRSRIRAGPRTGSGGTGGDPGPVSIGYQSFYFEWVVTMWGPGRGIPLTFGLAR